MLILKQNVPGSVPTPAAGKGTIFLNDSDVLSVKDSGGTVTSFPTVGGANTQVIFNDDSALAGAANFTFNKTTSVMTITGNVAATRVLTDNLLYANGVAYDFQQPAGSNTQVIFNDDGDFGADTNFTFNKDTDTLTSTNIAGLLTTGTQTNITSVGTLTALSVTGNIGGGNVSVTGEVAGVDLNMSGNGVIGGNLTVNGDLTYVNVSSFEVEDPIITMGGGANGATPVSDDGKDRGTQLEYYDSSALSAFMGWDNSAGEFIFGADITNTDEVITVNTFGNVHGNVFIGSGAGLSALAGANVTGTVANATHASTANTVVDAAQPNITSVGTLTSVVGGVGSASDFGNAIGIFGADNTGGSLGDHIGIVGEAQGDSSDASITGIGVYGIGETNGGTKATGVYGLGTVSATGDTGAAVGVRGIANATHASGMNVGLYGAALGSDINNYALYIAQGGIGTIENRAVWEVVDNDAKALEFATNGKANILSIESTDGAEGVFMSGYLNVTGNITATAGVKTDNLYYANGNPWDLQQPAGSNTQVIFNDDGDFGADSTFTFDKDTNILSATTVTATTLNGTLGTAAQPNITSTGTLSSLTVTAPIVGSVTGTAASATGTSATVTTAAQPNITSVGTLTSVAVTGNVTSGNVSGTGGVFTYVSGDGANLTSITGQNVSGEVDFAQVANSVAGANVSGTVPLASVAGTVSGAAQANITSVGTLTGLGVNGTITASAITANTGVFTGDAGGLSNVVGGNVTGTVALATTAGTVSTAAQPNITSVGTLASVTTTGNVDTTGNVVTDNIVGKSAGITITSIGTNQPVTLAPTGTGGVSVSSKRILDLATPTASTDAATKQYVDDLAQGLAIQAPCIAGTPGTLTSITGGTITYDNGTAGVGATLTTSSGNFDTLDGISISTDDRVLVKNEATTANNGIYVKTSSTVLTRADDFNTPVEMAGGDFVFIQQGTTLNDTGFVMTDPVATIGTDPATFVQFSGAGSFLAGAGLTLTGSTFSITDTAVTGQAYGNGTHNATFTANGKGQLTAAANAEITAGAGALSGSTLNSSVVDSSLTSVGTIDTGVWQGTAIGAAYVSTLNQNTTGTAGTVTTAAQPNITSVGTLTGLTVSGTISGSVSGSAGSATTAGSVDESVTFNDGGSGAASGTAYNGGTARTISYNSVGAPSATGAGASGSWGINVSGSAGSATTAGTVTTAAQPNITSTGTLSSLSVTGTTTTGTLQSATITTGSSSTAGTITGDYTLTSGSTLNATYADLAEKYLGEEDYEPGTVVLFGSPTAEVMASGQNASSFVAGIVTTNPAQVYNAALEAGEGQHVVDVALIGRVPCKVIAPIMPGDLIVSSEMPGFGCAADPETVKPGTIIGKAIGAFNDGLDGVVEVMVGRC